ncbi:MAG: glucose-1-phosphate adenylyltransferase [Phycisphaerales bacterium]|nr:glucose-1-phosphate adenylyltransferase [Phycisphaerae bacterium]NNF43903.1 glucose-1-phosphate adenylyltransferase [Phycisphaerales bacterium]NNM24678.1 glucose-1-phosphate adenylyltransferase [Phycisphaerales bacterium]
MHNVVTAILGGGQGIRLWPLTQDRAKPAVPVGGKFRLIDIPISNSLHGGINRVYVITQFNSASLHRHISTTYRFDAFSQGYVNILAAEQRMTSRDWYQGTADAVRQNLTRLCETEPSEILILSGDQLYLMNMQAFVRHHRAAEADLTVAVKPVSKAEAPGLGVMRIDDTGRIVEFVEKPSDPAVIDRLALDEHAIEQLGLDAAPGMVLASMGIYVFRRPVIRQLLEGTSTVDFGKEVIPEAIHDYRVHAFLHNGYWRDIGTIKSFHEANLELTAPVPALNLYDPELQIYTHPRFLPGCKINGCDIQRSIVCGGSIISASRVADAIVGVRAVVRPGTVIEQSYIMGANAFDARGIGANCEIRRAIVDLDATIGDGSRLVNEAGVQETDGEGYCIRDGIIVVHRGATIAPGTVV